MCTPSVPRPPWLIESGGAIKYKRHVYYLFFLLLHVLAVLVEAIIERLGFGISLGLVFALKDMIS